MKFGMLISAMHPWMTVDLSVQLAEASGADSYWVPDHMLGWFHPGVYQDMSISDMSPYPDGWYDPYLVVASLSRTVDKPFGMAVTDSARRRAPDVARTCLTLQHMCKGGFTLGIGSGEAENIVPFGYEYGKPVSVLERFLIEIRSLFDTGRMPEGPGIMGLPLEGEAGKPQVWVGGHGPRMLRLTGTYGDGWIPGWPMSPEEYGRKRGVIGDWARKAGRPAPTSSMAAPFLVGECRDKILEDLDAEPLAKIIGLFMMAEVWERHGRVHPLDPKSRGFIDTVIHAHDAQEIRDIAPSIPAEVVEEFVYLGNADEIARRIEGYARNGLEHVTLGNFTGIVGGAKEFEARLPEAMALTAAIREM
jgi:phthiodiolone/phenolphthiodiolone dimycocerosates ketoreductase